MKNKWVIQAESWKLHLKEILEIKKAHYDRNEQCLLLTHL